uniref:(northern house mosquito) hypothetical protein n=1 Tax=Culex pipiens TaxID=7175 RepID=A0A8D8AV89_CULPI
MINQPGTVHQPFLGVGVHDHHSQDDERKPLKFEVNSDTSGCGSSVSSEYLQARIRLLEERRKFRLNYARQEEEYFKQKLQLLAQLEEIDSDVNKFSSKYEIRNYAQGNVTHWLGGENNDSRQANPMTSPSTLFPEDERSRSSSSSCSALTRSSAERKVPQHHSIGVTTSSAEPNLVADEPVSQHNTTQQQGVDGSIVYVYESSNGSGQSSSNLAWPGLSPSQLAARQVIPSELPSFAGHPQDWPLFSSAFRTSTQTATRSGWFIRIRVWVIQRVGAIFFKSCLARVEPVAASCSSGHPK